MVEHLKSESGIQKIELLVHLPLPHNSSPQADECLTWLRNKPITQTLPAPCLGLAPPFSPSHCPAGKGQRCPAGAAGGGESHFLGEESHFLGEASIAGETVPSRDLLAVVLAAAGAARSC